MKKILALLLFACAAAMLPVACTNPPSAQVVEVKTLEVVGASAKAALDSAAQMVKAGQITVPQWQKVAVFYDSRFQPVYALAVTAAHSDLSTLASPDVQALAQQLIALVAQFSPSK